MFFFWFVVLCVGCCLVGLGFFCVVFCDFVGFVCVLGVWLFGVVGFLFFVVFGLSLFFFGGGCFVYWLFRGVVFVVCLGFEFGLGFVCG